MSSRFFGVLSVVVMATGAALAGRAVATLPDAPVIPPDPAGASPAERMLFNFIDPVAAASWYAVNDMVLAGKSRCRLDAADGYAVFVGKVSLRNLGGFASMRAPVARGELSGYDGLAVRVRGDGKKYKLFVKTNKPDDGMRYQVEIDPGKGAWRTIRVPFSEFKPFWRPWPLYIWPNLAAGKIEKLGLMIADGQQGPFRLEIQWVGAYSDK